MRRYLARKFGFLAAVLLGLVLFIFFLFMTLPGPEQILTGQRSDKATTNAIISDLGLDQPWWKQLAFYLNDLSPLSVYQSDSKKVKEVSGAAFYTGKSYTAMVKWPWLRSSFHTRRPVTAMIAEAFPGTLVLAFAAILLAIAIGVPLGVLAAVKQGRPVDNLIVSLSALGISVPSFFSAMLFAWLFGFVWKQYTGLSMTGSLWEIDPLGEGQTLALWNLILPALALGVRPLAVFVQLTRNTMVDVLKMDYIRTARSKGLSHSKVIWRHAFPNAVNPLVTSVGGWFSSLLAGSFFTEYIFNWKGLGKLAIEALQQSDLPVIMGTVLFTACLFFCINILTDILYFWLDPRLRYE
ncbi:MAG: ABC transporter permease [Bacteroidetes bacterium]|nr:ABC transporter permease [Bacteroidota bacterium]